MSIREIVPVVHGPSWNKFKEFINIRRSKKMERLVRCSTEDLKNIQGSVQELDYILGLEEAIKREANSSN